jgi:hypothetical protein
MLRRDAAHDEKGQDPQTAPVSLHAYRRAYCALLGSPSLPPLPPGPAVTADAVQAYRAGERAWQDGVWQGVRAVWRTSAGVAVRDGYRRLPACWSQRLAGLNDIRSDREFLWAFLLWDRCYDQEPVGPPPLILHNYRMGLSTVMRFLPPSTAAEEPAFNAGQQAAYDRAAVAVGRVWQPDWAGLPPLPDVVVETDGGHRGCVGLCGRPVAA